MDNVKLHFIDRMFGESADTTFVLPSSILKL